MFIGVIVLSAGLRSGSRGVSDDLLLYVGLMIFGIGSFTCWSECIALNVNGRSGD